MDFNDSPEEAAFRAEVRAWLSGNAPRPGGGITGSAAALALGEAQMIEVAKAWQAKKFDAGYAAITWPKDFGGRDGSPIQQVIYKQEEARFNVNVDAVYGIGLGMCVPIVRTFGSDAHKARYVRKGLRGEEIWCQLFSEPAAGSDVAGIRTRAVRDGDDWIIDGQKIWTSGAQFCDFGILLVRTNTSVPKHKGLTMFIVDMKAPGVEVRPVRQMSGRADFNEVFFDGVRIPDSDRLGDVDNGWHVAITTLMFERQTVGEGLGFVDDAFILDLARATQLGGRPSVQDARVRERIADLYINSRALQLLSYRAQTALSKGQSPGPEQSINKAIAAAQGQQASYLAMDLKGPLGVLTSEAHGEAWVTVEHSWIWGAGMRIAGGTDEILRNIIAERVLGLPADIRVDKEIPYDQLS